MSFGKGNREKQINYRPVAIKDFAQGDLYYVQKTYAGSMYSALCQFQKIERGNVHGTVVENFVPRGHRVPAEMEIGSAISTKPNKCYLWGKKGTEIHPRCIWFSNISDQL